MSKTTTIFSILMFILSLVYIFYYGERETGFWVMLLSSWLFYASNLEDKLKIWIKYANERSKLLEIERLEKYKLIYENNNLRRD